MPKHLASACVTLALLATIPSCRDDERGELIAVRKQTRLLAPATDELDALCSDLGDQRVCWAAHCARGVCVHERPLPAISQGAPRAYRCTGDGDARECHLRSRRAPPFRCHAGRCYQEQPRLPDDGDWECVDLAGVALCRGGSKPAGLAATATDPGWFCGDRRGKAFERICLDLDPDLPESLPSPRCRYELDGARLRRSCERADSPRIGARCSPAENRCPAGSACLQGVCLPPRPEPSCWGDFDCGRGTCVYGTCVEDGY